MAVRDIPSEAADKPHLSLEHHPRSSPKLGQVDRGLYMPGAMGEWTIPTFLHLLTLYDQREVRDVPLVFREGLNPTT